MSAPPVCPRPDKRAYPSKAKAEQARVRIGSQAARFHHTPPARSYECLCGAYHLTTQALPRGAS